MYKKKKYYNKNTVDDNLLYKKYDYDKISKIIKKFNDTHNFKMPEYVKEIITEMMDKNDKVWTESLKIIYFYIKNNMLNKYMNIENIPNINFIDIKGKLVKYDVFISKIITKEEKINNINIKYYLCELMYKKYGKMELTILIGITKMFYMEKTDNDFNIFKENILNSKGEGKILKILKKYKLLIKYDYESIESLKNIILFYKKVFENFNNISRYSLFSIINKLVNDIIIHNTLLVCQTIDERKKYLNMIKNIGIDKNYNSFDCKNKENFKLLIEYIKNLKDKNINPLIVNCSDSIRGTFVSNIINNYNKLDIYYTLLPMIFLTEKYNGKFFKKNKNYSSVIIGNNLHYILLIHYLKRINKMRKKNIIKTKEDKPYFYISIKKGISNICLEKGKECPVLTTHEIAALMFIITFITDNSKKIDFINNFINNSINMENLKHSSLDKWSKKNGFSKLFS
jgi:hypothetical protein